MSVKTVLQNLKLYFIVISLCVLVIYFVSLVLYTDILTTKRTNMPLLIPDHWSELRCMTGEKCRKHLPQVLIIGASKCGTTALSTFLSYHPNISIDAEKEIKFFNHNYERGFDWYLDQLPCSLPNQTVIERSADYFYSEETPERTWWMNAHTKIVLVACEPVRKILSEFKMKRSMKMFTNENITYYLFKNNQEGRKLNTEWYVLNQSNYSLHFVRWLGVFPAEQLHVTDGGILKTNPWKELNALESFLGIKHFYEKKHFVFNKTKGFFCYETDKDNSQCLASGKGHTHAKLDRNTEKILHEYYQPFNEIFYKLSRRRFNW